MRKSFDGIFPPKTPQRISTMQTFFEVLAGLAAFTLLIALAVYGLPIVLG